MEFLSNTENIRNICILAHVDHGKTTIADSLIASNGIISQRLAGKMRYLDSRVDEQERGITMKSSSIALKYFDDNNKKYLINLVDTPGHVDFCGEVSAAVRLCDGALIVIDVVEGVCPQTKVALEQAWKEGIEPILVLNKIDRMILEQQLDETAAYLRLTQILEQVNAIVATLLTTEIFEDESLQNVPPTINSPETQTDIHLESEEASKQHVYDWASAIEDVDDSKYYFMPEKNNVIFISAIHDWAFTIESFAKIISKKNKINVNALKKTLWGDFYIDMKQKRILPNAQAKSKKNLFTSMVLDNIWKIYDTVCMRKDKLMMEKICKALNIELSQKDMNHTDSRFQVKLVMSKFLNLSQNILGPVSKTIPSPKGLSSRRVERLLCFNFNRFQQLPPETQKLKSTFLECSYDKNAIKVACVSKMFPFERNNLPENKRRIVSQPAQSNEVRTSDYELKKSNESIKQVVEVDQDNSNQTVFIAFARVFSGILNKGDKLYVLGPKHDPSKITSHSAQNIDPTKQLEDLGINEHVTVVEVQDFYLLMGRELEKIDYALAGNIVGIRGLEKHLIRTATLSSNLYCAPFNDLHLPATPILRVAIEPKNTLDMSALTRGLKLLNQADPCVEVRIQESGEHVIVATGEVHLQHCLKDLVERYTDNIELNVSSPIVPFRETIVLPRKIDMVNETIGDNNAAETNKRINRPTINNDAGIIEIYTPNKRCRIKIKASPLPEPVTKCLFDSTGSLKALAKLLTSKQTPTEQESNRLTCYHENMIKKLRKDLTTAIESSIGENNEWKSLYQDNFVDNIWSFGPKYFGSNLLIADKDLPIKFSLWSKLQDHNHGKSNGDGSLGDYIDSFVSGFQLASQSGPLCEEPMMGVCFSILEWSTCCDNKINYINETPSSTPSHCPSDNIDQEQLTNLEATTTGSNNQRDYYGPMSGQVISTVKECCRKAFQAQPQRLMSPMFSCDIKVTTEALGKMYAVLGRRNGRILHGDLREGSQTFDIKAFLPVIESLDFVNEIRNQTSGMANPQLIFSHYELIDVDPFWTPTTEEEYTLFGEKADTENQARKYMNLVRRRKGLSVQEKIVEFGEKQRTIKRNK